MRIVLRLSPYLSLLACVGLMTRDVPREVVGMVGVLMMLIMLFMKVPIGLAMAIPGVLGIWSISGWAAASRTLGNAPFDAAASWTLSVIPMFVLMGYLLWQSGVTANVYDAAKHWLGWLPGGLAIGTNFAGAGFATVSGSTIGSTYALAKVGIPEMLRAGYDRRLSVASVLMAGTGGQLIPPSILLVVYAGVAQVAVGPQLIAGLVPGVVLALAYGLMILLISLFRPSLAGRHPAEPGTAAREFSESDVSMLDRVRSFLLTVPLLVLAVVVIGGMFSGFFTATEAGAVGAFGALVLCVWKRFRAGSWDAVKHAVSGTASNVASIFLLIIGALILSRLLAISGVGRWFADTVSAWEVSRIEFLLIMLVVYLFLGAFMDPLTMMLVTVPLLLPTLGELGIDLLWFGVFVVFLGELAIITPPVGVLTFIVHGITQDPDVNLGTHITLNDIFVGVLWFIPISVAVVLLLIFVPDLVLWLPGRM